MSETAANALSRKCRALSCGGEERQDLYVCGELSFTRFNMEMRRLYQTGEIGPRYYAEGEYNHPMEPDTNNPPIAGLSTGATGCPRRTTAPTLWPG